MKDLLKEFPATVLSVISLILMIPVINILRFVLEADKYHQIFGNYILPAICVGIILPVFELGFFKHDKSKGDDKNKEELKK